MKKGFILGLTTGVVLTGASLVLANSQIQAILNDQINLKINGEIKTMSDATTGEREYPITYKDRTYIPLRSVATLLGMNVDYDDTTKTAIVNSKEYDNSEANENLNKELIASGNKGAYYIAMYNKVNCLVDSNGNILLKAGQETNLELNTGKLVNDEDGSYKFESIKSGNALYYYLIYCHPEGNIISDVFTHDLNRINTGTMNYSFPSLNCIDESGNFVCVMQDTSSGKKCCCKLDQDGKLIYQSEYLDYIAYIDGSFIFAIDENKMVKAIDINHGNEMIITKYTGSKVDAGMYDFSVLGNDNPDVIEIFWRLDSENAKSTGYTNVRHYFNTKTHEVSEKYGFGG